MACGVAGRERQTFTRRRRICVLTVSTAAAKRDGMGQNLDSGAHSRRNNVRAQFDVCEVGRALQQQAAERIKAAAAASGRLSVMTQHLRVRSRRVAPFAVLACGNHTHTHTRD